MSFVSRTRLPTLINMAFKSPSSMCMRSAHRAAHITNQHQMSSATCKPLTSSCRPLSLSIAAQSQQEQQHTDKQVKEEIYIEAMKLVNQHGWTRKTLSLGAEAAGYAGVAEGLFNGGEELALHFIRNCNDELVVYLQEMASIQESPETRVPQSEFIRSAVEYRLRMLIPYIGVWPQALAILHSPWALKETVEISTEMIDDIWYYAGDRSTDINWYTKRGLLCKLYASTQLAMLNDNSPDFQDTWEFLNRRMDDIKVMGSLARSLSSVNLPQGIAEIGKTGLTSLLNIVGIGQNKRS